MKLLIKKIFDKKIINVVILTIYFLVMVCGQLNHELWRDEMQAWTIARDLSFFGIIDQMQYEGHPCLWHLILMPFAQIGCPPIVMGFISVFFMMITAILIMYKSPFNIFIKILLLLSSPFLYFHSIMSRVYSIIPFLICLLAIIHKKRMDKPILFGVIIAILVNTHAIMMCFAGVVSLFFLKDIIVEKKYKEKQYWMSFGIIFLGVLLFFLQFKGSIGNNSIIYDLTTLDFDHSSNPIINFLYDCFYGFQADLSKLIGIYIYDKIILYVILFLMFVLIVIGLRFAFKTTLLVLVPMLFIFVFHTFVWFPNEERVTMLIFYLMYAVWTHYDCLVEKKEKMISFYIVQIVLAVFCIITIPHGVKTLYRDINTVISGAEDTAKYINENLSDSKFVCPVDYVATAVAGHIDDDIFYSNIRSQYFSYVNWDQFWNRDIYFYDFIDSINTFLDKNVEGDVYILYSWGLFSSYDIHMNYLVTMGYVESIYLSPIGDEQESFVIYSFTNKYYEELSDIYM